MGRRSTAARAGVIVAMVMACGVLAAPGLAAGRHGSGKAPGKCGKRAKACPGVGDDAFVVSTTDASAKGGIEEAFDRARGAKSFEVGFGAQVRGEIVVKRPLVVTSQVTLVGPGAGEVKVSGGDRTRIFEVVGGGELTASGLTICHGRDIGSSSSQDRGGTGTAGAILNRGITHLKSVTVADNNAIGGGSEFAEGGDAMGGAVTNFGQLTVGLSTFVGNRAVGATHTDQGTASDRLDGGSASGGAIRNEGSLTIGRSEFRDNAAIGGDGVLLNIVFGIAASNGGSGLGGAIFSSSGAGQVTIIDSTLADNEARGGEGGYRSYADTKKSGDAGGGAVYSGGGVTTLTASTVTGNLTSARSQSPTNIPRIFGAGLALATAPRTLQSDTIVFNRGAADLDVGGTVAAPVANTILGSCSGTPTASRGYNIDYGASCQLRGPGDRSNTDARLSPFGEHGGPTRTLVPFPSSPAVDQGLSGEGEVLDQRGEKRPVVFPSIPKAPGGNGTDIGSTELQRLLLVAVSPESLDFGAQHVETISKPAEVAVTNVGVESIKVGKVTIDGDAVDDYSISSQTCADSSLAVGESCRVRIRFSPSEAGARTARLRVDVSSPGGTPPVALTGNGTEAPGKRRAGKRHHR